MLLSLAPMADITHLGFRRLVYSFKAPDLYYSEMVHSPSLLAGGQFEKWYMLIDEGETLIWQITSNETETIKDTIPMLLERGGIGIDLNMGCSAPHIVATGAGFGWIKKSREEVKKWVKNARYAIDTFTSNQCANESLKNKNVINNPKGLNVLDCRPILSVKMRLPSLEYNDLYDFASFLVDCGVDRITVHPRLQKEKYSRLPHYEYVGHLAKDIQTPVFVNGDIKDASDIKNLYLKFPHIQGFMIGRAAVQKPWIFQELDSYLGTFEWNCDKREEKKADDIKEILNIDLLECATTFIDNLKTCQPPQFHLLRAKRFFNFFCNNFIFSHYIRSRVLNAKNMEEIFKCLSSYFGEVPEDRFKR